MSFSACVKNWQYNVVASVSGVLSAFFQAMPSFADPDSFYHTKLAWMLGHGGLLTTFPWLKYSLLAEAFTDQHLLYHLWLWLWMVLVGNAVVAAKVAQAISVVVLMVFLFHRLKRWKLPFALPAMLLLTSSTSFFVRIQLVKASTIAILLLLVILFSVLEQRYITTAIATLLYSWSHGGFILALVVAVVVWLSSFIINSVRAGRARFPSIEALVIVLLALGIGIITNPYFPNNLSFLWQQLVQIGFVNYRETIAVGAEWYPLSVTDFLNTTNILLIAVILACVIFVARRAAMIAPAHLSLYFLLLVFLVATLRSRRFIEYFVPIAWLWSCSIVLPYLASDHAKKVWQSLKSRLGFLFPVLIVYFALTLPISVGLAVVRAYANIADGKSLSLFQGASQFLQTTAPPGELVFNAAWDEFPLFFFHNTSQVYVVGLDATFLYLYDKERYQRWNDISTGKTKNETAEEIAKWFGARYAVVDRMRENTKLFQAYLRRDPNVRVVYQDETSLVFEILQ